MENFFYSIKTEVAFGKGEIEKLGGFVKEFGDKVLIVYGGGSSIDCSKAIAAGYYYDKDPWDLVLNNSLITKALPLVNVSTLSATGSEMDCFAVISNEDTKEKKEICSLKIE